MIRIAAFASGGGTNVQALLDHFGPEGPGGTVARVALVLSDRDDAYALERARKAGVATRVVPVAGRDPETVAVEIAEALGEEHVELIALAGYVRLVPPGIVAAYAGRILNVHPALLPAFGGQGFYGIRIHRAVIERGCRVTGVTVHFVDEEYDRGPILCQWPVPVLPADTPESLARRVLAVEHRLYPAAVELVARRLAAGGPDAALDPAALMAPPDGGAGPWAFGRTLAEAPETEDVRSALGLPLAR